MATVSPAIESHEDHSHGHDHHEIGFVRKYIFSTDHKIIGIQFLITTLLMLMVGGALALGVRWQLAFPWESMPILGKLGLFLGEGGQISPEFYTMLFTMHGTIMIFFVIIPMLTGAFGNFLIPLMIGAPDMAFPRLNMIGYWAMVPGLFFAIASFFVEGGAAAAGWTAYPPLSTIKSAAPGSMSGQIYWLLALTFSGISSMAGAVNYATTVVKMRAPGMTLMRMPLTIWSLFIAALLQLFALPVLTAVSIEQILDRVAGTSLAAEPRDRVEDIVPGREAEPVVNQLLLQVSDDVGVVRRRREQCQNISWRVGGQPELRAAGAARERAHVEDALHV